MSIKIENLFYTYSPKTLNRCEALKNVSLTIEDNSFVAFLGQTGSGKSTLIQTLNGLLIPDGGQVQVDEYVLTNKAKKNKKIKELRKHLGIVFQFPEYQLFEDSVERDVAFGPKNFGLDEKEALEKAHIALKSVGLDETYFKRSPFELSGGEKRRVAIAGILAIEPDILVLDEPTAGLDPKGEKEIMNLITDMHKNGKTIILVTHDMDIVMKYCQKVFVLKNGELVFEGDPYSLFILNNEELSIEVPTLFELARKVKDKGLSLDLTKIKNIDDFVDQYMEKKHDQHDVW